MKMMKRFTSIILVLCMVLSLVPAVTLGASAADTYTKTDLTDITATDVVVVTMTTSDGTTYALTNGGGTSTAPEATIVDVNGDTLSGNLDSNLLWNISYSNGNLTIYPNGDTSKWLYCTDTNNGVRVGTNNNKVFTIDSASGYLMNTATSRYVGVYTTNPDWRCYTSTSTNIANQTLAFYVLTGSAAGSEYMVTFSTPDGISAPDALTGSSITLPTLDKYTNADGKEYTFVGWVTGSYDDATTQPGTVLTGTYAPNANITLNALYTWSETIASGGAVSAFMIGDSGSYVIAANVDGTYYALPNGFASTLNNGKLDGGVITVTDGAVSTSMAAGYAVTLTYFNDYYTISDGSNYLKYASGTDLAIDTSAYNWTISNGTKGTWRITSATAGRGLLFRAGNYDKFGGYATSNISANGTEYYDVEILPVGSATGGTTTNTYWTTEIENVATPCTHTNTTTTTVDATCTATGSTTVTCNDCGYVVSTTTIDALGHSYTNGYCAVCGAADPNTSTTGMIRASIKIITGSGKAWFKDSEGNIYALTDDSGNALGNEATEKAKIYRTLVPIGSEVILVLQPAADQRLASVEQNDDRLEAGKYPYDSEGQYFTYTFTAKDDTNHSGVENYFRITFLPRLSDGGYTAEQAAETNVGDKITAGLYVMTGISGLKDLTLNAHSVETTYLLYADGYTVLDDGTTAVGRKSSALQLASVGVSLNADAPYRMTAINKNHLVDIQPYGDSDYYTIELAGARGYYLKGTDSNNLFTTTETESGIEDEALWKITYLGDGAYEINNKAHTNRYLRFNSDATNLQFRTYQYGKENTITGHAPVLYRATKVSQLVTYTVSSGTDSGSIYAYNNSAASAVASGTYQAIHSELTFTFTPAFGYQLDSVTVNGTAVELNEDGTYTCTAVEGTDIRVVANYSLIPADRDITVNYYVNNELKHTVTAQASLTYTVNMTNLPTVTVKEKSYTFDQLAYIRTVNGTAIYMDLQAAILVEDGDEINVYFSTTDVTLNKTVTETTDKNTDVNDKNGGLNSENFTDSNDKDTHGNVKQTFEVELYAQSFSHADDEIKGNTDVIVVLDNSNSMHFRDSNNSVYLNTDGYLAVRDSIGTGLDIISEVNSSSTWSIIINSSTYAATITCQGGYTDNTLAFDSANNVFTVYPSGNSMGKVLMYRVNTDNKLELVKSVSQLQDGDKVFICDHGIDSDNYIVTNYYMDASTQNQAFAHAAYAKADGYYLAKAFTLNIVDGEYTFYSANTKVYGATNSEYTMDALTGFYDTVFAAPGNRVGIVKFNSYGYIWNGSSYQSYNGSLTPSNYTDVSYENCYLTDKSAALNASWEAIGAMEVDDGATNFVGAWLMTYVLALARDTTTDRSLVVVFFTDGQPTVSYKFTGDLSAGSLKWSTDNSDMHPIAASGSNIAGGVNTSAGEYYFAMELAQTVRYTIESKYPTGISIHNVALLNDATLDVELVNRFMSDDESVAKQWYYYYTTAGAEKGYDPLEIVDGGYYSDYYLYGNVSNETYKSDAFWLPVSTLYGDSYADSYTPVTGDVSNSLNAAFDSIAVTITPGKVVEGTIVDTIPADFTLTPESEAALVEAGWTVTPNSDGTTTITKPNVHADIDGESFTYEIQYQGNGYGAEYTNVEAKYIYEGVDDKVTYESYFPMPVVNVIPWTVNDGYTAETNVAVTLDVLKNDLFEELTAGGYTLSNFTVTLTDINGKEATYFNAQAGGFDAVVDPASNTVSFMTEKGDNHVFYYVVSATVTAPNGTKTVVYSRATRVDVLSVSAENVSDLDVLMAGQSGTIPLLHNDKLTSGTGTNSNSVTLTDSNGDPLDLTQLSAISNVSVDSATGELTYTAVHSGVEQFWYVNQITASDGSGNTITVPTPPTKVTILVLENAAIVVDYGYTTQSLQAHPDLGSYTVDDGVTLDSVVKVSYPDAAGTYGTAAFQNGAFTFTPATTMYNGVDVFNYSVEVLENNYSVTTANHQPTVTVVPANSIYFEESFLNYATSEEVDVNGNNLVDWSTIGTAAERYQSTDNVLYGNDTAYSAYTEGYSGGSGKLATVTEDHPTAVAYFTFSGTGFDICGLSSQDTGFLLAEVYAYNSDNAHGLGKLQKYVMVDTYIQGKTYEQLPILCCRNLAYGEYAVKIRVVYEMAFDHNLTATRNESIRNEDFYRQLLGLQAGIPMELSLSESAAPATRSVPSAVSGSYSIVIDGLRIYQPLNANPENAVASELYQEANELGLSFYRIRDLLLSADQWADKTDGNGNVNGLVYIAADLPYTEKDTHYSLVGTLAPVPGADDTTDSGEGNDAAADETVYEGVYLTPTQTMKVDENGALIAPNGKNATIKVGDTDYVIYVKVVKDNNGKRYSYYYKDGDTEVTITPEQIEALGLMHIANYYAAIGPKYELYLTNGNGIAFNVIAGQLLHLSAKVPVGESANLLAYVGGEWKTVATVKSRTELYFDLTNFVNEDGSVILKCEAPEGTVLSLCNIKTASLPTVSQQDTRKAVCIINGKEIEEENEFRMNHSISFNSDLRMNYRIKYSELAKLASNYVADGAYLVVEKDVYLANGSKTVETVTLTADLCSDPDRMIFYLDGITSVEMGSELRATLHFFDAEGKEHVSPVDTYSVLDYAKNCFKNYTDPQLYTMLIDLLNYGAAAQLYFGRNAAAPVNAGLDAYQKYSSTSLSAELNDEKTIIDNSNTVTAITSMNFSVNFDERTVLNVKMTLAEGYSYEDISCVKVLDENGNELANIREFDILSDGRLQFSYEGITSTMMRQMCYFVAYVGDQIGSQCVGYSIEAYVGKHMDFSNIKVSELMMRCIYYGDSAEAFFKN